MWRVTSEIGKSETSSSDHNDTIIESLKQKVMDVQLCCGSSLPLIWVIEALACSNHVEASLLLDFLKKTPQLLNEKNVTELVSLKFLQSLFIQGACANPVSSALSEKVRLDPSDHCEDVLRRILTETSQSHLKPAGPEMSKWDLEPFIEHKKSKLRIYALKQLKDAIVTGSLSISASLKEQSGLPVGTHAENQAPSKDGNCSAPRVEGRHTDDGNLMPSDLPDENLVPVNRKRRSSESPAEQLCTTCINPAKKNKHYIISNEQYVGGQLISSVVHKKLTDASIVSVLQIEEKRFGLERRHLEPPKHDAYDCTPSGHLDPNEVLSCGKKVPHFDNELNNKSEEQQRQDQNIEEEGGENKACDLITANDSVDRFELCMKSVDEVEENVHVSNDNDGTIDFKTDVARKENASLVPAYTYRQDSLETTDTKDQHLLADVSRRYSEERCRLEKETSVEVMRQNGSPRDGNNRCNSSKGPVGNVHVLTRCGIGVLNEKFDMAMQNRKGENTENGGKGFHVLISTNEDIDKFDQNVPKTDPTVGEAEDGVDISSYNDGYHDERTAIDTKKKAFLSSQCTYSQDLFASTYQRELHLCMKCRKGGNLLSCTSYSCSIMVHKSCLGSDESFDAREAFYCPFCAYSRAISKYMEVKKYASLARKDLATFICLGPQNESNKQSYRSFRMDGNCLKHNDGLPKSNELNQINVVDKVSNHQCRKDLEYEQVGPSVLRSDHSPPFGRNAADSTDRLIQSSKRDKQKGKGIREESQPSRGHRGEPVAAEAVHNSQSETKSCEVSETSDVRSKKGVTCPPETDLPCEHKCSQNPQSTDAEEISEEENEDSWASKYFVRDRKQERLNLYPAKSQLRRKRLPWTSKEEDILKNGVHKFCSPHDNTIPWKKILRYGEGEFHPSRSTMDLKDKWRNICKACPKSK